MTAPVLFTYNNKFCSVLIKREICAYKCEISVFCDENGEILRFGAKFSGIKNGYDEYRAEFDAAPGLYYVSFKVYADGGVLYTHDAGDGLNGELKNSPEGCAGFQLLITSEYGDPDPVFENGNMYHIFVDRFRKSGKCEKRSDAVYIDDWDNGVPEYTEYPGQFMKNNTFFGGDLYGITEKLGYIKDLGCDIVYLSPIFRAFSNHRYDVGDYERIDENIGGEKAFKELCKKAHSLGMRVILDGVFNHTGDDSVYFNKFKKYGDGGAYNDPDSPYRGWYTFKPDGKYACWWGVESLPELNGEDPGLTELITGKNGVIRKYLRLGADGWRLDVADELSERMLDLIKKAALEEKPDSVVIGEVWEDATNKISYGKRRHYFSHAQLDSVMDYPLKDAIINYVKTGETRLFSDVFNMITQRYPEHVRNYLMNFLGTHDTERILTVLGGDPADHLPGSVLAHKKMTEEQYKTASQRFYIAFALLCFMPGIVSVYYGDEAGMQGYRDPFNRMPYPWGGEDPDIRSHVKKLLHIRKDINGDPALIYAENGVIVISRGDHIFISDISDHPVDIAIPGAYEDENGEKYADVLTVRPYSYHILKRIY